MNNEIAKRSSDPFDLKKAGRPDLEIIPEDETVDEREKRLFLKPKHGEDVNHTYRHIIKTINNIQRTTAAALEIQRNEICEIFDSRLAEIKKQIQDEKAKKGENTADFKEREKELKDHLETMT